MRCGVLLFGKLECDMILEDLYLYSNLMTLSKISVVLDNKYTSLLGRSTV